MIKQIVPSRVRSELLLLVAFAIGCGLVLLGKQASIGGSSTLGTSPGVQASEGAIYINGNTQLGIFAEPGGAGTPANPYVIKDKNINAGDTGSAIYIVNTNAYLTLRNCTLTHAGTSTYDSGNAGLRLENCTNVNVTGNTITNNGYKGIFLDRCSKISVGNNTASSNWLGIHVADSSNCTISKTVVWGNYDGISAIESNDVVVLDNNITSTYYDGISLYDSKRAIISGNRMYSCGINLEMSSADDPVYLYSHVIQTSNLVNGKPVYYRCNTTGLLGSDFPSAGQVLLVNCNDSRISGLNINGGSGGILVSYAKNMTLVSNSISNIMHVSCIKIVHSRNITVSSNDLSHALSSGVFLDHVNDTIVSNNNASYDFEGIKAYDSNRLDIHNNNFTNNPDGVMLYFNTNASVHDNQLFASSIRLMFSTGIDVWNNTVMNCTFTGIKLYSFVTGCSVSGNKIYSATYGISLESDCDNNVVLNNVVAGNSMSGIYIAGSSNNTVRNNIAANNSKSGVHIYNMGSYNNITGNKLIGNIENGIFLDFSTYNTITGNIIMENGLQAKCTSSANITWDVRGVGNFWGDYSARYPAATNNGTVWSIPYAIGTWFDHYPLAYNPIDHTPAVPVLAITTPSPSSGTIIDLAWTSSPAATYHLVYRHTAAITYTNLRSATLLKNTTLLAWQDKVVALGRYYYAVVAGNTSGPSFPSNSPSIIVQAGLATPALSIGTPSPTTNHTIQLSWVAIPWASNYTLYRSRSPISQSSDLAALKVSTITGVTCMDTVPTSGVYYFALVAANASAFSNVSNSPSISILVLPPAPVLTIITSSPTEDLFVYLIWTSVPGASSYSLYQSGNQINSTNLAGATWLTTTSDTYYYDYPSTYGVYWYAVVSTNASGNSLPSNSSSISIQDMTPPQIWINVGPSVKGGMPFYVSVYDNAAINLSWYNWDGAANQTFWSPYQVTMPGAEGPHNLTVGASDGFSVTHARFELLTDSSPPVITLLAPQNDTVQKTGAVINFSITDASWCFMRYRWNSSANATVYSPFNVPAPSTEGTWILRVYAIDFLNLVTTRTYRFTLDGTAPTIAAASPTPTTIVTPTGGTGNIAGSIIDLMVVDVHFANATFNWDGGANVTLVSPFDIDPLASPGTHLLTVYAFDLASNHARWNCTYLIIVVPAAPSLAAISPASSEGVLQLSWNAVPGAAMYFVYRSNASITSIAGLVPVAVVAHAPFTDTLTKNGTYYYAIVAANSSGSSSLSNVQTITVVVVSAEIEPGSDPTIATVAIIAVACGGLVLVGALYKQGKLQRIFKKPVKRANPSFDNADKKTT